MKSNFYPDLLAVTLLCSSWSVVTISSWGRGLRIAVMLTSSWTSAAFSYPKVISHQWSAAVKHQRTYGDCTRQIFCPMSIMQQLDWHCAIQSESVAVVSVISILGYLCGVSDCLRKKKSVLIKSPLDFSNLSNPYINRVFYLNVKKRWGIFQYKWTYA